MQHAVRTRRLMPQRMNARLLSLRIVVAALLSVAAACVLLDLFSSDVKAPKSTETFSATTARLDDPLDLKHTRQGRSNQSVAAGGKQRTAPGGRTSPAPKGEGPAGVICSNSCPKARDGVCDEGRRGNLTVAAGMNHVHCDLGTDCDDCGPWHGVQAGPAWSESVGPIAYLQLYKIAVMVKQVPIAPKFIFAFTDPAVDSDQSTHMQASGAVEGGISQVFHKVLSKRCNATKPGGNSGFVVDVGANFGWFSLLSASLGCSVLSVEPVPIFRAFMEYSAARNHLTHRIELLPAVVAPDTTKTYTINAPLVSGAQWGASGMDVPNHPGTMQIPARAVRLDDLAYPPNSASDSRSRRSLLRALEAAGGTRVTVTGSHHDDDGSSSSSSSSGDTGQDEDAGSRVQQTAAADAASGPPAASSDAAAAAATSAAGGGGSSSSSRGSRGGARPPPQQLRSRLLPERLASGMSIVILKVDVEGREPDVFATATRLLGSGKVDNVIMEYSPGYYYQASDRRADMESLPLLLLNILRHNYSMVHIPWSLAHDVRAPLQAGHWDVPLPTMDAVTAPQLAYDLWTTQHIRNGTLPGMHGPTSWPCPEMAKSGMGITEPGHERFALHVAFHPKAFMAHFIFNTNVWATKDKGLQTPGTGLFNDRELFPFYWPSDAKWFPQSAVQDTHPFGMPWAYCEHIPASLQVAHRCRCRNWDVCGQHQVAVQQCVAKKQTGYTNIDDAMLGKMLAQAAAAAVATTEHAPGTQ